MVLSSNPAPAETTPLLNDLSPTGKSSKGSRGLKQYRFSQTTLLIPAVFTTTLASVIPKTVLFEILQRISCAHPNIPHDDMVQCSSTAVATVGVMEGITSIAACCILNHISSHYGRKPAFISLLVFGIMGSCLTLGSQYMLGWISGLVFFIGMLFECLSGILPCAYVMSMYVIDICGPENRTSMLSKISAWAALGSCVSFALGRPIGSETRNTLFPLYVSAELFIVTFIYALSVLPESSSQKKGNAPRRIQQEPSSSLFSFRLLKVLLPTRRTDGTRNWRLVCCAAHTFMFTASNGSLSTAWLVLAASGYGLTPVDTVLFLGVITATGTAMLMFFVPLLIRSLRPYYSRKTAFRSAEEGINRGEEPGPGTSDQLNVHLAFVSCVITATFFLIVLVSKTRLAWIISGICLGLSFMHIPTILSLVSGSVEPLKQGEALAAIQMVASGGTVLSSILMYKIATVTVDTASLLLFYVHLGVLISGGLLFLIRDADRYRARLT